MTVTVGLAYGLSDIAGALWPDVLGKSLSITIAYNLQVIIELRSLMRIYAGSIYLLNQYR
jgi:hypothetical protein